MIEQALREILTAASGVTALVSTRIAPGMIPQDGAYPRISFEVAREPGLITYDGQEPSHIGKASLHCWGNKYLDTRNVAAAAISALQNYAGTIGGVNIETIYIEDTVIVFEDGIEKYRETILLDVHTKQ